MRAARLALLHGRGEVNKMSDEETAAEPEEESQEEGGETEEGESEEGESE
jgi:hypothetical protein